MAKESQGKMMKKAFEQIQKQSKNPNKHMSTTGYKTGLKKETEGE